MHATLSRGTIGGVAEALTTQAAWQASTASSADMSSKAYEAALKSLQSNHQQEILQSAATINISNQKATIGLADTLRSIYATSGFVGLFRGAGARVRRTSNCFINVFMLVCLCQPQ